MTITTTYQQDGVTVTLQINGNDSLPYNLAAMFARVVKDTDANPEIVIDELKTYLED